LDIASIALGSLAGVLGVAIASRAQGEGAAWALLFSCILGGALALAIERGALTLSWTWLAPICAVAAAGFAGPYGLGR
jgi:hypothetical protein